MNQDLRPGLLWKVFPFFCCPGHTNTPLRTKKEYLYTRVSHWTASVGGRRLLGTLAAGSLPFSDYV